MKLRMPTGPAVLVGLGLFGGFLLGTAFMFLMQPDARVAQVHRYKPGGVVNQTKPEVQPELLTQWDPSVKGQQQHAPPTPSTLSGCAGFLLWAAQDCNTTVHVRGALLEALQGVRAQGASSQAASGSLPELNVHEGQHACRGAVVQAAARCVVLQLMANRTQSLCTEDKTLPLTMPQQGMRVLIAGAIKNNEQVLPHYITQVLLLVLPVPQGQAFVSILESGSTDASPTFISVLRMLLAATGVPAQVISDPGFVKQANDTRIPFLARVRNRVLEPLWSQSKWYATGYPADKIVYLNDVYACAADVIRLLQYRSADLACGLDLNDYRKRSSRSLKSDISLTSGITQTGMRQLNEWHFYDVWVGRDAGGSMIDSHNQFMRSHSPSQQRLNAGWPMQVHCCWNGLAVLNAAPFVKGLRFRSGWETPGECTASECSLMCMDFMRMGYNRFILDPSVRVTYAVKQPGVDRLWFPVQSWAAVAVQLQADTQVVSERTPGSTPEAVTGAASSPGHGSHAPVVANMTRQPVDPVQHFWEDAVLDQLKMRLSDSVSCCGTDKAGDLHGWSSCKRFNLKTDHNYTHDFLQLPK